MKIQLLDGLTLDDKGVLVNRNGESVHRRQGDIDGACGPYCIVMAHLALGDMTGSEIEPAVKMDFRTRVGRMFRAVWDNGPMVIAGTTTAQMREMFRAYNRRTAIEDIGTGQTLFPLIRKALEENKPVILDITGSGFAHWTLAVGCDDERIYLLDPGYGLGHCCFWNASVQIKSTANGPYNYLYANSWVCQHVRVGSILVVN